MYFRNLKLIAGLLVLYTNLYSQSDTSDQSLPSNSFEEIYKIRHPKLKYAYNSLTQTHAYSDNWDFDGDGKKDKLLFVGDGGVHLYYHLQLWLSSEKKTHDFPSLAIDYPFLFNKIDVNIQGETNSLVQFVVANFDTDELPEIYINLNKENAPNKCKSKKLSSYQMIIDYRKNSLVLINFRRRL